MTTTTYYNLNIVEGTDIVNPLIVDNPNYEKIDEKMHDNAVAGVTLATEIANATVHAITRENSDCAVIRFIATSVWKAGDTATVDGVPVTALLPSGETLPDGAYVINANVLCILTGTNLTIYAERKKAENANEIAYNNTTVGAELDNINTSLQETNTSLQEINSNLSYMSITDLEFTSTDGNLVVSSSYIENGMVVITVNIATGTKNINRATINPKYAPRGRIYGTLCISGNSNDAGKLLGASIQDQTVAVWVSSEGLSAFEEVQFMYPLKRE